MPEFIRGTPYTEVFDMVASVAFYCDILGFEITFASAEVATDEGRFSHFVRLRRGGVELMLNTAYDSNERPVERSAPRWAATRHWHVYVDCVDVPALYAEMAARGLRAEPPALTGYGLLAFPVADPDGYGLTFQQPA